MEEARYCGEPAQVKVSSGDSLTGRESVREVSTPNVN